MSVERETSLTRCSQCGCEELESEEDEEGHHEAEEPHGLWEGKAEDGVGEELLLEDWMTSIAHHKTSKHWTNSSSWSSHSDCSRPGSDVLGCLIYVPLHRASLKLSQLWAEDSEGWAGWSRGSRQTAVRSERLLGQWCRPCRNLVVIASRCDWQCPHRSTAWRGSSQWGNDFSAGVHVCKEMGVA